MTLFEMIVSAIKALQSRGFKRPGNHAIQETIKNMYGIEVSIEDISHYTDVG